MSYILEALKKSQQERELGRVPTLDKVVVFEEDKVVPERSHWALLAVGLAAVAMIVALYAALRGPATVPPPAASEAAGHVAPSGPIPGTDPGQVPGPGDLGGTRESPGAGAAPAPLRREEPSLASASRESRLAPQPAGAASLPKGPATAAIQTREPLIEPPPPKQAGRVRFPDPVEEPSDRADSAEQIQESPNPPDPDEELELQRQIEADDFESWDDEGYYEDPAPTPVPRDLIADIESFKREVQGSRATERVPPAKPLSRPIDQDPQSLRLTPAQEADLPGYLMTAHVYDADQSRRFVLINGLKYREGDKTREGMKVERIIAQGTVLSYRGNPFFVQR